MDAKVTDDEGRDWHITLTLENVRAIKNDLGIDMFDFSPDGGFAKLISDPNLLGDAFCYLVNDQRLRRELTDKQLTKSFFGKYAEVVEAMKGAFLNFSPPQKQGRIKKMFRRYRNNPNSGGKPSPSRSRQSDSAVTTSQQENSSPQPETSATSDGDELEQWRPPWSTPNVDSSAGQ